MTADCFLCLCPRKKVEPDGSNLIRQCENTSAIQASLDRLDFNGKQKRIVCMAGGGIAVEATGTRPEVVVVGKTMAVLIGIIQNYAYLVRKYLVTELGLSKSVSLEAIRQGVPISEAALLCKLYQRLGTGMLTKLRGRFGFCLYDSTTEKVLAARDPTGSVGLVQGQTREGDFFIASGSVRPEGALNVVDIHPGKYKYGWRAAPRKFASPQVTVENRAAVATDAAAAALAGIAVKKKLPSAENCGEKSEQILCRSSPLRRSSCTTTDLSSSCETGSLMEGRDLSTSTSLPSLQTSELDLQSGWDSASELEGSWSGRLAADQKAKKIG